MSKPSYSVYTKDFANMVCRRLERENKKKDKELERLHSIIKKVREYTKEMQVYCIEFESWGVPSKELLEIVKDSDKE